MAWHCSQWSGVRVRVRVSATRHGRRARASTFMREVHFSISPSDPDG